MIRRIKGHGNRQIRNCSNSIRIMFRSIASLNTRSFKLPIKQSERKRFDQNRLKDSNWLKTSKIDRCFERDGIGCWLKIIWYKRWITSFFHINLSSKYKTHCEVHLNVRKGCNSRNPQDNLRNWQCQFSDKSLVGNGCIQID